MPDSAPITAHDFTFEARDGGVLPLRVYAGRPLLVVNTASKCGFTGQYAALQDLWRRYRDRGLVVLGVPCNDFGAQEPGSAAEIAEFCTTLFGVDFPMTAKTHARGPDAHPFFLWVEAQGGFLAKPRWNFYKYLIGPDGSFRDSYTSLRAPASSVFETAIARLVAEADFSGSL